MCNIITEALVPVALSLTFTPADVEATDKRTCFISLNPDNIYNDIDSIVANMGFSFSTRKLLIDNVFSHIGYNFLFDTNDNTEDFITDENHKGYYMTIETVFKPQEID